jgi:thioredoxin-like negative regulator of GroEL
VLAESWCGDAAQIVPFLSKIAEGSEGKMALTILFRDEQVELMNEFLTNGTRSIPKLIATDEGGNVLFQWGPRPKRAQDLMLSLKQNPELSAEQAKMQLHKWYAENKGADVLDELMEHIQLSETAVLG